MGGSLMAAIPIPSFAGEQIRYNGRDYIAYDDSGVLIWTHDHSKFIYLRDHADFDLEGTAQSGYFQIEDTVIMWSVGVLSTGQNMLWVYPKSLIDHPILAAGSPYWQSGNNIHLALSLTNPALTSIDSTIWNSANSVSTGRASIVGLGHRTPPSVTEHTTLPASPTPGDEIDYNGRHMIATTDGAGNDVWVPNRRAYAAVDDNVAGLAAERYLSIGNLMINLGEWADQTAGVRSQIFHKPYGSGVIPVCATAAEVNSTVETMCYFVTNTGCQFRAYFRNGDNQSYPVTGMVFGASSNPYPDPVSWPVPLQDGEKFHYRNQYWIAVDDGGTLVWSHDANESLSVTINHIASPENAEHLDINSLRILAAPLKGGASTRTEVFDVTFDGIPQLAATASASTNNDRGCTVHDITETGFSGKVFNFSPGGGLSGFDLNYIAAGLKP